MQLSKFYLWMIGGCVFLHIPVIKLIYSLMIAHRTQSLHFLDIQCYVLEIVKLLIEIVVMFFKNSLRNTFCTNLLVEGVLYFSEHVVCWSNISIMACNNEHQLNFEKHEAIPYLWSVLSVMILLLRYSWNRQFVGIMNQTC